MLDYLFEWMNQEVKQPKIEDVLVYEIPNRVRRCSSAPLNFLGMGTYIVEIQDLRKSVSQGGRPYFSIEMLILESSNLAYKKWTLVQEMYMLDSKANIKKAISFLESLQDSPKDLTIEMLFLMLSDQDEVNWNSPFAGVTMTVDVKEIVWDGGKKTNSTFKIWK
jgi:hypothetical protein